LKTDECNLESNSGGKDSGVIL